MSPVPFDDDDFDLPPVVTRSGARPAKAKPFVPPTPRPVPVEEEPADPPEEFQDWETTEDLASKVAVGGYELETTEIGPMGKLTITPDGPQITPPPAAEPVPAKPSQVPLEQLQWPEFLRALGQTTLLAVLEMEIAGFPDLLRRSREQLLRPLGRLTKTQLGELDAWLNPHGWYLKASRGPAAPVLPLTAVPPPTPQAVAASSDNTLGQRRNARLARNVLTY